MLTLSSIWNTVQYYHDCMIYSIWKEIKTRDWKFPTFEWPNYRTLISPLEQKLSNELFCYPSVILQYSVLSFTGNFNLLKHGYSSPPLIVQRSTLCLSSFISSWPLLCFMNWEVQTCTFLFSLFSGLVVYFNMRTHHYVINRFRIWDYIDTQFIRTFKKGLTFNRFFFCGYDSTVLLNGGEKVCINLVTASLMENSRPMARF